MKRTRLAAWLIGAALTQVVVGVGTVDAQAPENLAPGLAPRPFDSVILNPDGVIKLGVRDDGALNLPDAGIPSRQDGTTDVGLRLIFPDDSEAEATAPGCLCEGWGASGDAVSGWANADDGGNFNLFNISFAGGGDTALSVVEVGNPAVLRVTHEFVESATPNLYRVNVTLQNVSGGPLADVRYRRVMDWDIPPTTFSECVTINSGTAADLAFVSNNGFDSSDPLLPADLGGIFTLGDRVDDGPDDHGALFQFEFGGLSAGEAKEFDIFYGAAFSDAEAEAALAAAAIEAFSYGKPHDGTGFCGPDPENTFIFAFAGVGGSVIIPMAPPAWIGALAAVLLLIGFHVVRRRATVF